MRVGPSLVVSPVATVWWRKFSHGAKVSYGDDFAVFHDKSHVDTGYEGCCDQIRCDWCCCACVVMGRCGGYSVDDGWQLFEGMEAGG